MRIQSDRRPVISNAATAALPAVAGVSALLLAAGAASAAASLTYDANTGTAGVQDGAGAGWNTSNVNWHDGAGDVVWANTTADTAIFGAGGAGASVSVGTVNVGTIQFNATTTTGYTIGTAVNNGTITLGSGITQNNAQTSVVNSKITGSGGLAFVGNASVQTTLSGANDYTGITTLSTGGRLASNNATAFGSTAGATASTLGADYTQVNSGSTAVLGVSTAEAFVISGSGQSNSGAIRINNAPTISSLVQLAGNSLILNNGGQAATISGNIALTNTVGAVSTNYALTLQTNAGAATVTGGVIQTPTSSTTISGDVTGAGSLTVQSANGIPWLFNNAKSYTGATNVTGALGGTGSFASSSVTIAATTGVVTAANYNTVGTLTFDKALTINGTDVADLTAAGSDTLAVGTVLTLGGTSVLKLQGTTGATSYTLATYGSLSGTFAAANIFFNGVAGLPAGYTLDYGTGTNSAITLQTPEPATLGAIGMAAATLLRRRRRA